MRLNQDMKGFAVTPIVFIGLFIITGLMLVSFSDLDRKLVDGISKVSSIKTLEAGFLSNKTSTENILYLQSVFGLERASTQAQLQQNISRLVEDIISITSCQPAYFTTSLTKNYYKADGQALINKTYTIGKNITCIDAVSLNIIHPISIACSSATFSCS